MTNADEYNSYLKFIKNIRLNISNIAKRLEIDIRIPFQIDYDLVFSAALIMITLIGVLAVCIGANCICVKGLNECFTQNLDTEEKYNLEYIKNDFNNMFIEFKKEFDNKLLNEPKIKKFENKLDEKLNCFFISYKEYFVLVK